MQVGTRIRITLRGASEDFVVTHIHNDDVYAASVLDANDVIRLKLHNAELSMPEVPEALIYIVYALSGNLNLDMTILAKVDADVLNILSDLDSNILTLIQSNEFWYAKVAYNFGEDVLRFKPLNVRIQDFYKVYADIWRQGANAVLHSAAEAGDPNAVQIALNAGAKVNTRDNRNNTPLMWSSRAGPLLSVQELLRAGANVGAKNKGGKTALMMAAEAGRMDVVQALLAAGAKANIRDSNSRSAAQYAMDNGHIEIAILLDPRVV